MQRAVVLAARILLEQDDWLQVVGFYEYYEGLQEGWDGPALLVFSDGEHVGARLDRNGLRPARFWVTSDDIVYVASEVPASPLPADVPEMHLPKGGACCTPQAKLPCFGQELTFAYQQDNDKCIRV